MFYKVNSKGKCVTPWQNVQSKVKFNDELEHIDSIPHLSMLLLIDTVAMVRS